MTISSTSTASRTDRPRAFRELHDRDGAFLIVNPWDVGSAKILENLGFEALATTSGGHAWSVGRKDGETGVGQKLEHCRALASETTVPISADLGIGFGTTPDAVAECVRLAAGTGIAGGSIEDASVTDGKLFDFSLAVDRIQAAVETVKSLSHDFVLTARCESFVHGHGDLDQTIKRLQAYSDAGADVLFAPGLTSLKMIRGLCQSVEKPVNVLTGFSGMTASFEQLQEAGVKRVSVGTQLARIAYGALIRSAKELKSTSAIKESDVNVRSSEIADRVDSKNT